jgi:AcrR family transcriptional regulator
VDAQGAPRRRLKGPERREQLLSVAMDLAGDEGLRALTMERVAARANISKPVLYSHFDNRGMLLNAILTRYWEDLDRQVAARLKEAPTPIERVYAVIEGYFDAVAAAGPVLHRLMVDRSDELVVETARTARFAVAERRWSSVYEKHWGLSAEASDVLAALLRGALESAASYWVRSETIERDVCVQVCRASFRGTLAEMVASERREEV